MPLYVFSRASQGDDDKAVEEARALVAETGARVVSTAAGSLVVVAEADEVDRIRQVLPDWRYAGEDKPARAP